MAFAIDEINRNPNLLPNVTLGYSLYDNCVKLGIGFRAALSLASGLEEQLMLDKTCARNPPVLGIVGDSSSTRSIAISSVLGLYRVPMVSYFATCSCLSDRQKFPSFFRTIPSDAFQVRAMIQILRRFGWTWAGLLISDDDYGLHAARSFQSDLAQSGGGCLAYLEVLPWGNDPAELRRIVEVMRKSTSRVVIVFAHESHVINLMKEVVRQNVTGLQWMASEAWTAATVLQTPQLMPYLGGTLGIAIRRGHIPGFRDFLLQIHPELQHSNSFGNNMVNQFWEHTFQCKFAPPQAGWVEAGGSLCTGQEDLENVDTEFLDISNLRPEYNVYKAVYALAYALDNMLQCEPGRGPFSGHSCGSLQRLEPWQLVYYLEKVNFTTPFGDQVSFDENGDALPIYDVMNWLWLPDGRTKVQNVGEVKESAKGFRQAQTMVFAIDEINRNSNLLPNVTLGYSLYDNCLTLGIGFRAALSLASGQEEQFILDKTCAGNPPVVGIVGDASSTRSIAISAVLGLYRVPMVRAMIQILRRFGWTWAGLLISDDDYGLHAARSFQSDLAQSGGGCLAYLEVLPWGNHPAELRRIVDVMRKSTARVVIVFAHENLMINLMKEVVRQNVTGLQWMASEAWTAATVLQTPQLMPYLGGTLGIAIRRGHIPGFRDFLLQMRSDLQHNTSYGNILLVYYLEKVNFTTPFGDQVSFDENGDVLPIYDVMNWLWLPDGRTKVQNVGFRQAQTMVFAIDEINRNSNLLPNVTLGYSLYDNCLSLGIGFRAALSLASGQEEQFILDKTCAGNPPVVGIVGDASSTRSIAISAVLGLYRVPMVRAMIQILRHFGWTWTGLLVSDDDYGLHAARSFQSDLAHSGGGCLAYLEVLPWGNDPAKLRRIVDVMRKSTARVVIAFTHENLMINLMKELVYYLEKVNFTTPFGDQVSFDENGDVLPIYDVMNWLRLPDGQTKVQNVGFRQAQTMAFAIDEINRNSNLLPNVTLGYSLYDNCLSLDIGFRAALSLASGQEEQFILDKTCAGNPPVVGIVGDASSTRSIAISAVLGLYRVPMVRAMIQILRHFGWTWAGLLISDNDYGLHAARSFQSDLAQSGGGCLAYLEVLPWGNDPAELRRIVDVMRKSTARVVIAFAHENLMINLMKEVVRQNVTGLQWMASEGWTAATVLQTPQLMPYLGGTLGIAIRRGHIPGFRDFLLQMRSDLQHNTSYGNILLVYYLEKVNFTTPFGDQVSFDENGDALPIYDVMNWVWLSDGRTKVQNVGEVKESAKGEELTLDEDKIFWNFESKQVTSDFSITYLVSHGKLIIAESIPSSAAPVRVGCDTWLQDSEDDVSSVSAPVTVPGQHLKHFLDEVEPFPGNTLSGVKLNRKQVDDDDFQRVKDKLINDLCDNLTTQFGSLDEGVLKAAATMFDLSNWPEDITDLATFGMADVETFITHFQKTDGLQRALWNTVFPNSQSKYQNF
ncbi:hypothetical protein ABVT39_015830 [Epinephelus coioides]